MCRPLALFLGLTLVATLSGCRSTSGQAQLERELHSRDVDLIEMREELYKSQAYNKALQAELGSTRGEVNPSTGEVIPVPPLYPIRNLTLGRQTGGYDQNNSSGDTALQVIVEPRDVDNHVIKVPGCLTVQALEVNAEGLKKPLSSWEISTEQLRASWRGGLFGSAYALVLPWKNYPTQSKLRVIVQLQTTDGRTFEADRDVTVKLLPGGPRTGFPPVQEKRTPLFGNNEPVLPAPNNKPMEKSNGFGPEDRLPPPLPPPSSREEPSTPPARPAPMEKTPMEKGAEPFEKLPKPKMPPTEDRVLNSLPASWHGSASGSGSGAVPVTPVKPAQDNGPILPPPSGNGDYGWGEPAAPAPPAVRPGSAAGGVVRPAAVKDPVGW